MPTWQAEVKARAVVVCVSALAVQHFRRIYLNYNRFHYRIAKEQHTHATRLVSCGSRHAC